MKIRASGPKFHSDFLVSEKNWPKKPGETKPGEQKPGDQNKTRRKKNDVNRRIDSRRPT